MEGSKQQITFSIPVIIGFLIFCALGWFVALFFAEQLFPRGIHQIILMITTEIFKAIFVAFTAGYFVNRYLLRRVLGESKEAAFREIGIKNIYRERLNSERTLVNAVISQDVKKIYILGISLRDFLSGTGHLQKVWEAILRRLKDEQRVSDNDRLRVHLLLLDPRSSEGRFRDNVQRQQGALRGVNLKGEVQNGLDEIFEAQKILDATSKQFLQVRLYDHCPFSFIFATDRDIFAEQYCYRSPAGTVLPLIRYSNNTAQYNELRHSITTIWDHAHQPDFFDWHPRTAAGIEGAAIRHIFRKSQRDLVSKREVECLRQGTDLLSEQNQTGITIKILATSAKFYTTNTNREARDALLEIARKLSNNTNFKVKFAIKFAIVNPVSQQAIMRAIADNFTFDPVENRNILKEWTWDKHRNSRLFGDIQGTIHAVETWKERFPLFELRLYSSSIACAMLLTPNSVFIKQYLYGRSSRPPGLVLGGEYPIFELGPSEDKVEWEVLQSHFDLIGDFFRISLDEYKARSEHDEFEKNRIRLLGELKIT